MLRRNISIVRMHEPAGCSRWGLVGPAGLFFLKGLQRRSITLNDRTPALELTLKMIANVSIFYADDVLVRMHEPAGCSRWRLDGHACS